MAEIQSLARGLRILEIMADCENGIGITELADQLGVDKSTASRLVQTLLKDGFVQKAKDDRSYTLGPMLVNLSRSVITRMPLRDTAKPYLKKLVEVSGECSHIAIYAQGKALYIDQMESSSTLRVNVEVGQLAPLHCTALGKILLAFGNYPLPVELEGHTEKTITDLQTLEKELETVRDKGYAIDDEEFDNDVRCISVPVFDFREKLVGAIGISGPSARLGMKEIETLAPQIIQIGKQLSDRLKFKRV
ncbi:MAG: IclR family transcriptional regulator [Chloroflexi bacterium]|nr:IclR family transcriptional regulator [Chloroflexota bacterium]